MELTSAIVLAGGLGTRLRGVIGEFPKPMAPVRNRPFLEYLLDYWIAQGIERFVLSVAYRSEIITGHFGSRYGGAEILYAVETNPLDTGGALLLAAGSLNSKVPFLVLNGDSFFKVPLVDLDNFSRARDADWCLSTFPTTDDKRYTPLQLAGDGRILSFRNLKDHAPSVANGGVYWIHPRVLAPLSLNSGNRISLEKQLLPEALLTGKRLYGITFSETFIDIGVPEDYERAAHVLANEETDL